MTSKLTFSQSDPGPAEPQKFAPFRTHGTYKRAALISLFTALILAVFGLGQSRNSPRPSKASDQSGTARGKYIVEGVARCGQCHTQLDNDGNPDQSRWLQGAPIRWVPAVPDSNWPLKAPRIGGVPLPASDEDMIKLLTTGIWTTGERLRSPMPQFRMDRTDAEAVVAYLKSLTPQP